MTSLLKRLFKIGKKPPAPAKPHKAPATNKTAGQAHLSTTPSLANKSSQQPLNAIQTLHDLGKLSLENTQLRPLIEERALTLINQPNFDFFNHVADIRSLITHSSTGSRWSDIIKKLPPEALTTLATEARLAEYRVQAAELIDDENTLESLEKQAKNKDKRVFQIARKKLHALRDAKRQHDEAQQRLRHTLDQFAGLLRAEADKMYEPKLQLLHKKWQEDCHAALASDQREYNDLKVLCQHKLDEAKKLAEQARLRQSLIETQREERAAALGALKDTLERFTHTCCESSEIAALDALIKTQENRWNEACQAQDPSSSETSEFRQRVATLKEYRDSTNAFWTHSEAIERCMQNLIDNPANEAYVNDLSRQLNQLVWPAGYAKPAALTQAYELLQRSQPVAPVASKKNEHKINADIAECIQLLEKALDSRSLKESQQHAKRLYASLQSAPAELKKRYAPAMARLMAALDDLKDWAGFATNPKLEELCTNMELLCATSIEPQLKAEKIKLLQQEWKQLGGSANQQLWERFKLASDRAFEPCKRFFEEEKALKSTNLAKRETICTELEMFIRHNNWTQANWKAVEEIAQAARQDWKAAYPIEFKNNREVQKKFNVLLGELDEKLNNEREQNKQKKQALITQAQALTHDTDIAHAIRQIKLLQAQWKSIGITHHKDDRQLWKTFRTHCDQVFLQRDELNMREKDKASAATDAANQLIAKLQHLSQADCVDELERQLTMARQEMESLAAIPGVQREQIQQALLQITNRLDQLRKSARHKETLTMWQEIARKSQLCLEKYQTPSMNLSDGEYQSRISLPPPVETRLASLRDKTTTATLPLTGDAAEDRAQYLCLLAEILAGIESPPEYQAQRMQIQVNRLSGAFNTANQAASTPQDVAEAALEWYELIGISSASRTTQEARIQAAVKASIGSR